MESLQRANGEGPDTDTLMLFGGVAMLVFAPGSCCPTVPSGSTLVR